MDGDKDHYRLKNVLELLLSPRSSFGPQEHLCCLIFSSCSLNYGGVCLASDAQFSDFLGSMGPAQFVGRQTLATTPMGECPKACSKGKGKGRRSYLSLPSNCWLYALSTQPLAWSILLSPQQSPGLDREC